jgi:poly(hydroxyalkanoate) depolymerase family esterase
LTLLKHRLFVPARRAGDGQGMPLVVALHGCTQTAADFAAGSRFDESAERHGALVLYPEQSTRENAQRCWNWFLPEHQVRGRGEPAAILGLVEDVRRRYPVDPDRIFIAGMSAGGAMAAILAEQAPDVFSAVGIMAGVALHASHDIDSAFKAMQRGLMDGQTAAEFAQGARRLSQSYERLRATIWTGTDDHYVTPQNALTLSRQFLRLTGVDESRARLEALPGADVVRWRDARGRTRVELWRVAAMGHAWSGGSFRGSHTYPAGPYAGEAMMEFFLNDSLTGEAVPLEKIREA